MTPEAWQQVNRIVEEAADLPAGAQFAAVHELADGDALLAAEVMQLLQGMRQSDGFLEAPLLDLHALLPETSVRRSLFQPDAVILNRFQIRRFLASGGMGEVYEAWDKELQEAVALKTIRPEITRHPEVIERFKQEVRNARGISHPNICRVYDIFRVDGTKHERTWFLSMELVKGTTLLECVQARGCLPRADALALARQMAAGLEAAHQFGLVHRDFKSANVMLVEEAERPVRAVIMDFGLSARTLGEGGVDAYAHAGTPGYMAPEQERGGTIGPLADQYAFGVVLCEMLSGMLPVWRLAAEQVHGKSTSWGRLRRHLKAPTSVEDVGNGIDTGGMQQAADEQRAVALGDAAIGGHAHEANAAAVQIVVRQAIVDHGVVAPREKPRLRLPAHRFSPRAERVIRRCMERDPVCRFPDMKTAADTLVPPGLVGTPWRKAIAACLLVVCALGAWRWNVWRHRCLICDVVQLTPDTDQSDEPSLSADGKLIAYSSDRAAAGNLDIFLQKLPNGSALRLTRDRARDTEPSLSPDGMFVAFRSEREPSGIYLLDTRGGVEHRIVPDGHNPRFSPDGKSLTYWTGDMDQAVATGRIFVLNLSTYHSQQVAANFQDARYPVWSTDGRRILFTGCATQTHSLSACFDWWVDSIDNGALTQTHATNALRLNGLALSRLTTGAWDEGEVLFGGLSGSKRNLWSIDLSPNDWQVHGRPTLLIQRNTTDLNPTTSHGTVAYTSMSGALHVWKLQQFAPSSSSELVKVTDDAEIDTTPSISQNGRFLVFQRGRAGRNLILRDTRTDTETLLLQASSPVASPIVDSGGRWLAFEQQEHGNAFISLAELGVATRRICSDCDGPSGWFIGDQAFFFRKGSPSRIYIADTQTGQTKEILYDATGSLGEASWSSANHFLVFTVTRATRSAIWAVRLRENSALPEGPWIPITNFESTAHHPCWAGDGRRIYYVSDRDGSQKVFGQLFSPEKKTAVGDPLPVLSLRGERRSIDNVTRFAFNLSCGGDSLFLNLGEQTSTIQVGRRSAERFFFERNRE